MANLQIDGIRPMRWVLRCLGRYDVESPEHVVPRFRSRTASAVFAYLALQSGRDVSRTTLYDCFWPESDGDRQAQNLRRALSDIRDALGRDGPGGALLLTSPTSVSANPDAFDLDVTRFNELVREGLGQRDARRLEAALDLYAGPLLAPLAGDWIYPYRLEVEETFAQAVEALTGLLLEEGKGKEALRRGRSAVLAAPLREEIHIALITAYKACGLEAEALRQFQEWERLLDEEMGEAPSEAAVAALEATPISVAQTGALGEVAPFEEHLLPEVELSGGAVPLASPYYVSRDSDERLKACLGRAESVLLVQGPRQVGKTSLLARAIELARRQGCTVALADFQTISASQLESDDKLYRTLAYTLAKQLGQNVDFSSSWSEWLGPNLNLDAVVQSLLESTDQPVVWALDEVDRVFGRAYANDFFGLLRSWHNRRALDPDGPWSRLTLILTYATEAHLFITDLNQSPFNVGVRIELQDFTLPEVEDLHGRYGSPLTDGEVESVHALTHGHPFLTRRVFDAVVVHGASPAELEERSAESDGPFGDHLRRLLAALNQDGAMMDEVRRLLAGEPFQGPTTLERLAASGVVLVGKGGRVSFRVPAYGRYLAAHLAR